MRGVVKLVNMNAAAMMLTLGVKQALVYRKNKIVDLWISNSNKGSNWITARFFRFGIPICQTVRGFPHHYSCNLFLLRFPPIIGTLF